MLRVLASVVLVAWAAPAMAQTPETPKLSEGARLFEEGRELGKQGKWVEACDRFTKSYELDPAVGTKLNLADCHEHLRHFAQAYNLFEEAAEAEKTTNPERALFARNRLAPLAAKVGTVIVKLETPDVPGLAVSIAGRAARAAAVVREVVDPGEITVQVSAPNAATFSKTARADAGATVTIEVPALVPATAPATGETRRRKSRVIAAYVIGGVGVLALTTGVLLGVKANGDYDAQIANGNCTAGSPPMCNMEGYQGQLDAVSLANIGTGFGIGGLALMVAGAVVFVTAPKDVVVTPTVTSQSAGLAVVGRF
jgi:hypothetical protein